jgi:Chaperone of endosialidase
MKKLAITILLMLLLKNAFTQSVAINTDGSTAHPSALLEIKTSTKGLLIPRMTTTARNAITTPATGLLVYDSSLKSFYVFDGIAWTDADSKSQLEKITENFRTGYRLLGRNPANYGNTGADAVDFSASNLASTLYGATGDYSFATGINSKSQGYASFTSGSGSTAGNNYAVAMGQLNTAAGVGAVALGTGNNAVGASSTALGNASYANGGGSLSVGSACATLGDYAMAMGLRDTAAALGSFAIGADNYAASTLSFCLGFNNTSTGGRAGSMGTSNNAIGYSSIAIGTNNNALNDFSGCIGVNTKAAANYAIAMGNNTIAKSFSELAVGIFNDTLTITNPSAYSNDTNRIFTVGTGTGLSQRKTGFVIQQNGNVGIGVSKPEEKLHIDGNVNINSSYTIEFGANVAGKQVDAGKIGYEKFTLGTLDIVGAGTTQPLRKIKFWAEGGAIFTGAVNATAFNVTSDARYKTGISKLSEPLQTLTQLHGVTYHFNSAAFPAKAFPTQKQYGFLAQEVEAIIPELVSTGADGFKSVNYSALIPLLTESIKELKNMIDSQNKKIQILEQQLNAFK